LERFEDEQRVQNAAARNPKAGESDNDYFSALASGAKERSGESNSDLARIGDGAGADCA
jgi:hypothetical protein